MINKDLRDRLVKTSTISSTDVLTKSEIFNKKDLVPTDVPMINVALSGDFDGGLAPGLLLLAAESKHFKTGFGLMLMSSFLKKYKDGIILFYDSEFGAPEQYFDQFEIDKNRVVHTPITNIEELRHDIAVQLKEITRGDHVFIFIDSIGNLASAKEVNDAESGHSAADMTRAKTLKSLFRIVTPHLTMKHIPMVVINHVYKEMALYPRDIVSGGTGPYLSANDIWIIGRQKDTEGEGAKKELLGYNFVIRIEKSRFVKEGSKIPINVTFEAGIRKYSGMFDVALEGGFITSPSKGYYSLKGQETKYRRDDLEGSEGPWIDLLADQDFRTFINRKYRLNHDLASNTKESDTE